MRTDEKSSRKGFRQGEGEKIRKKKTSRPSMTRGLKWLADYGFQVSTVFDVGAARGSWSKRCMSYFPGADHVLFEPQPVYAEALAALAGSCEQKVVSVWKAAGASTGYSHFLYDPADPFSGVLHQEKNDSSMEVELTTIDKSLSEIGADGSYLLKLDAHG
jgi:FkbM family methyltransferase